MRLKTKTFFIISIFLGSRENELGTNTSLIRAIKYATIATITVHLMSCVWFSLACPNIGAADTSCDPNSWAMKLNTGESFYTFVLRVP